MIDTTRFKSEDLFESLGREEGIEENRRIEVYGNEKLTELIDNYKGILLIKERYYDSEIRYKLILDNIVKDCSSKLIEDFSILMGYEGKEEDFWGGLYLSALVNNSPDEEFLIHLPISDKFHCLGYKNEKNLTIKGNARSWLGKYMRSGKITLIGDAGSWAGNFMTGGEIFVEGNLRSNLGNRMKNGRIIVNGNAGIGVGHFMEGGEIHINGDYIDLGDRILGKIYHKGDLIRPGGLKA